MFKTQLVRVLFAAIVCTTLGSAANGQHLYWASDGAINRALLTGGATEVLVSGLNDPHGVAVDPVAGKVYWAEYGAGVIRRANLDGTNVELFESQANASRLTVDAYARRLFFTEYYANSVLGPDRVYFKGLAGAGGGQQFAFHFNGDIRTLAMHPSTGEIFFATCFNGPPGCPNGRVYRTSGGATSPSQLLPLRDEAGLASLALDRIRYGIYWAAPGMWATPGMLLRADLGVELVEVLPADPGFAPYMAVDPVNEKVYWSVPEAGEIRRTSLDGSELESFKIGLSSPAGIDVLPLFDCNNNSIDDICDVLCGPLGGRCDVPGCGSLVDLDRNGRLDVCDADCNGNSILDVCEVSCDAATGCDSQPCGTASDCDFDGLLDECEVFADCNANTLADHCDIGGGASLDCNENEVPDECDLDNATSQDCNANNIPDECDIESSIDCNANLIPDDCDIALGTSDDLDGNGLPDECCPPPCPPAAPEPEPDGKRKNRYLSFSLRPNVPIPPETAIQVELSALYHPNPAPTGGPAPNLAPFEGQYRYLNTISGTFSRCCISNSNPTQCQPIPTSCNSDTDCTVGLYTKCLKDLCPDSPSFSTYFRCARLGCTPEYRDWNAQGTAIPLHVSGDAIAASSSYDIVQLPPSCAGIEETCVDASPSLHVETSVWGDLDESGRANAIDIGLLVVKLIDFPHAIIKPRAQLREAVPNPLSLVGAQDLSRCVDAVKGRHYPISFTIVACP
jgi:hypothetical protein